MSDRSSFLESIRADPKCHTTRLAYADFLEENNTGDLDAATAEFLRASCSRLKASPVMPKAAYRWLEKNWARLIPSVLAFHVGTVDPATTPDGFTRLPPCIVRGRNVWMRISLEGSRFPGRTVRVYNCSATLTFWKGFLVRWSCYSDFTWNTLKDATLRDQPFCRRAEEILSAPREFLLRHPLSVDDLGPPPVSEKE